MKKALSLALVIILTLSLALPIHAEDTNAPPPAGETEVATSGVTVTSAIVNMASSGVTADALMAGYTQLTGISESNITSADITAIEELDTPVQHLKVQVSLNGGGGFDLHLPPKEVWEGRFYQLIHPTFVDRNVSDHNIAFAYESGAYTLQTSGPELFPGFSVKMGLNVDAAAAHISRTIAKNYYNYSNRIYGYVYGGSGGSMQALGALEASESLRQWEGVIPYICAAPISQGNANIRTFARIVLEDKAPQIADAVSPGGSGDPYAGLTAMEGDVLREVTRLGLPLSAWQNWEYLLMTGRLDRQTLIEAVALCDKPDANSYLTKFWTEPGFLGTEDSELGELFRRLKDEGYDADGLAGAAYHRHIDPGSDYLTWDYLKDSNGTPLYAQIGGSHFATGTFSFMSGFAPYNGNIGTAYGGGQIKTIMVQNLMDVDSFPTDGHHYRQLVRSQGKEGYFRIYLNEYADHQEDNNYHLGPDVVIPHLPDRLINYVGSLEQALRDLSAWVENGTAPPDSTSYTVQESQLIVAKDAASRRGIQPVVDLTVNGAKGANISAGGSVNFSATIKAPPGTGDIVSVEWDFFGDGNFIEANFTPSSDGTVVVTGRETFTQTGIYYPQVRAVSQRDGDTDTQFARVENLGRARVAVGTSAPSNTSTTSKNTSSNSKSTSKPVGPQSVTQADATASVQNAVKQAKAFGFGKAIVTFKNAGEITLSTMNAMVNAADGTELKINADSMNSDGNGVDVRLSFNPASATKNLNLSASTYNARAQTAKNTFQRFFSNDVTVVSMAQQGSFGMEVTIAVKISPNMNTSNLVFYAYNKETNNYSRIPHTQYRIDKNGFVHFNTTIAGDIVISDGLLQKK